MLYVVRVNQILELVIVNTLQMSNRTTVLTNRFTYHVRYSKS